VPTGATAGRPYPRGAGQCPRATPTVTATVTAPVHRFRFCHRHRCHRYRHRPLPPLPPPSLSPTPLPISRTQCGVSARDCVQNSVVVRSFVISRHTPKFVGGPSSPPFFCPTKPDHTTAKNAPLNPTCSGSWSNPNSGGGTGSDRLQWNREGKGGFCACSSTGREPPHLTGRRVSRRRMFLASNRVEP